MPFISHFRTKLGYTAVALWGLSLNCPAAIAAAWPPTLDKNNPVIKTASGRVIERYTHGARLEWGYPSTMQWTYPQPRETGPEGQTLNSFYVVYPRNPHKHAPLCVVMHSANRTAYDYLGFQFLNRKVFPDDEPGAVMTGALDDAYVLYLNSTNDEWWGWNAAQRNPVAYRRNPTPAEKRILDTISWVITRYKIDRDRIYLSGVSMGGCGTLGIGLPHGDLFAAIMATVPAGTGFAALRMHFPDAPTSAGRGVAPFSRGQYNAESSLPDPPILVEFSAQNDAWSNTQPALLSMARVNHLALVLAWAPFGHIAFSSHIVRYPQDDVTLAFPWMEIRKDSAYPVFTNASSNQRSPWEGLADFDDSGEINAYFRWQVLEDKHSRFCIKLWIVHPDVTNPPITMPNSATADISLRRLRHFKVVRGTIYSWRLISNGKLISFGNISPDSGGPFTIPQVTLSMTSAQLIVQRDK